MDYTYKPTEYEIKLIILYTIKTLKVSSSYTMLDYVISSATNVNYFELEQYIATLMDKDNIIEYEADGNKYFSITESGEETLEFFSHKIPGSIRNRLEEKIAEINRKERIGNKFYADYFPINENEYTVKFSMEERGAVLLTFELYAGSRERAVEICSYLKNNTIEFYKQFTEIIDKGLNNG